MYKIFKILFSSSKSSFLFISFIIFTSLFSFIFTWNIIFTAEKYIKETSKDFLWADLVINDRTDFLEKTKDYIEKNYDSETSKKISFQTSIFLNDKPDLYSINYIEKNYPFYWDFNQTIVNSDWELIVSKKVYENFWDNHIEILGEKYKIKSYLESNFLADFNPFWWNDIYLDYDYYDKNLSKSISRISFDLLVKTDKVKEITKDQNLDNLRINSQQSSNWDLTQITDRLNIFIQIFYQIIILLAFFIVSISLNSYFKKITKDLKTLNILWLSSYKIIWSIFIVFLIIAVISSSISYTSVYILFEYLSKDFSILSTDISLLYKSIFLSFLIILSWSFLNLINLKVTWINNYSKEKVFKNFKKYIISYFIFLLFILFFVSYFSGISILYSFILSISFIIFILIVIFLLNILLKFNFNIGKNLLKKDFYLFDAIRSTIKPWNLSIIIVLSSFISISWFLIFSTFSNWFINFLNNQSEWKIDTFVINLNDEDIEKIKWDFKEEDYFEIIRSRVIEINWNDLKKHFNTENVSGSFTREFNTTTRDLSELIIEWNNLKTWEVWVDEEFADDLWVKIWDEIKFLILWIERNLKITQIRKAERNWVTPFFYFNFFENDFKWFSKNYFLSYNSKEKETWFNKELSEKLWESATFIDIADVVEKVKTISEFVLYFVYTILIYIWFFSVITFITSINFLKNFKKSKIEIYNKFWWDKIKLKKSIFYEYLYIIFIWLTIASLFSLVSAILVFSWNQFLTFNISYFLEALLYIFIFLIIYLLSYFLINRK